MMSIVFLISSALECTSRLLGNSSGALKSIYNENSASPSSKEQHKTRFTEVQMYFHAYVPIFLLSLVDGLSKYGANFYIDEENWKYFSNKYPNFAKFINGGSTTLINDVYEYIKADQDSTNTNSNKFLSSLFSRMVFLYVLMMGFQPERSLMHYKQTIMRIDDDDTPLNDRMIPFTLIELYDEFFKQTGNMSDMDCCEDVMLYAMPIINEAHEKLFITASSPIDDENQDNSTRKRKKRKRSTTSDDSSPVSKKHKTSKDNQPEAQSNSNESNSTENEDDKTDDDTDMEEPSEDLNEQLRQNIEGNNHAISGNNKQDALLSIICMLTNNRNIPNDDDERDNFFKTVWNISCDVINTNDSIDNNLLQDVLNQEKTNNAT